MRPSARSAVASEILISNRAAIACGFVRELPYRPHMRLSLAVPAAMASPAERSAGVVLAVVDRVVVPESLMSLAGVSSSVTTVRLARRDPRLAQAAVGVDAGVAQVDELADALGAAGAGERVDTAAVDLAKGVAAALAILVD